MPGSTTIARGNILAEKVIAVTLTPGVVQPSSSSEQAFTVPGVQVGDYINAMFNGVQTNGVMIGNVRVTGVNTVAIQFLTVTTVGVTPAAGTYGMIWGRPEYLPLDSSVL